MELSAPESVRELTDDAADHGWDEFVEQHPCGTWFHGTTWRALITRHFSHRPRYLEVREGGRRTGVLPLFETRSPLSGRALVSVPYAVYGGPLARTGRAAELLLQKVRDLVLVEGLRYAELRCREDPGGHLPGKDLYCAFVRRLPADPEECLGMIPRKSRATTRQARDRFGLEVVEDPGLLDRFHHLFVANKKSLGSPAFARSFFADLLTLGRHRVRLHAVRDQGQVVMAALSFLDRDTWNPYYSGSVAAADRMGAGNFLYWTLMREACAEGFTWFDFGRSRADSGAARFKRNMGFEAEPLAYRYVLGRGASIPRVDPSNPAFSLPRRIIQHLPHAMAARLGPALMRLVP